MDEGRTPVRMWREVSVFRSVIRARNESGEVLGGQTMVRSRLNARV